jgi:hypothetical protein
MPNKKGKRYKGGQRQTYKTMAPLNRNTLRCCPTTLQAHRIIEYQGNTFKKGCDVDTTLLPEPPNWT